MKTETFDLYKYEYKQNGDVLNIYIGGKTDSNGTYTDGDLYAKYNYDPDTDYLDSIEYGNDQTVSYSYNSFGQVTEQRYKASPDSEEVTQFKYQYTADAQTAEESKLVAKYDYNINQKTVYSDDLVEIFNLSYDENNKEVLDEYYSYQNVKTEEAENGTSSTSTLKEYVNKNNLISEHTGKADIFAMNDSELFSCNYNVEDNSLASTDVLNQNGDKILDTEYSYNEKGYVKEMTTTTSTGIVHKISYDYEGDKIKEYTETLITDKYMPGWYDIHFTYDYDSKGQLRRENKEGEYTRIYSYDERGNLKTIKVYEYTDGEITDESVINAEGAFEYDKTAWLDKINIAMEMPAFYDNAGNPISIDDCRFNWTNGRQLESMADEDTGKVYIAYTYDENGIRTSKIDVDRGTTTYYTTIDGRITSQYTENENGKKCGEIEFLYDGGDEVIGAVYEDSAYHYIKNASGDVIGIVNSKGDLIASYVYDGWGNPEVHIYSSDNSLEYKDWYFAYYNPMQYRSYYQDYETNLYYLQSRYYMSLLCRFVNSDIPEIAQIQKDNYAGTNLFAYCCNDPVNNVDYDGYWGKSNHYNWTYSVAKSCGFYASDAKKIAKYCKALDEVYPSTAYAKNLTIHYEEKEWQYYHFNKYAKGTRDSRIEYANKWLNKAIHEYCVGRYDNAYKWLGYALHCLQDIEAHGQIDRGQTLPDHIGNVNGDNRGKADKSSGYEWTNGNKNRLKYVFNSKKRQNAAKTVTKKYINYFKAAIR